MILAADMFSYPWLLSRLQLSLGCCNYFFLFAHSLHGWKWLLTGSLNSVHNIANNLFIKSLLMSHQICIIFLKADWDICSIISIVRCSLYLAIILIFKILVKIYLLFKPPKIIFWLFPENCEWMHFF